MSKTGFYFAILHWVVLHIKIVMSPYWNKTVEVSSVAACAMAAKAVLKLFVREKQIM